MQELLLPPTLWYTGYSLMQPELFKHLALVLLLAVLGTFITAVVLGLLLWAASPLFLVETTLPELLVLAALLSATDPVAVISMFESLSVNHTLAVVTIGTSLSLLWRRSCARSEP